MSADTLLVGAPLEVNTEPPGPGSAHVFIRRDGDWVQSAELKPSSAGVRRCSPVPWRSPVTPPSSVQGSLTATMACGPARPTSTSGRASLVGADQAGRLVVTAERRIRLLGDIEDDTIVVGARNRDSAAGPDTGAVYVFSRVSGVWAEQTVLTSAAASPHDRLGFSVAVAGGLIVAGAPGRDVCRPAPVRQSCSPGLAGRGPSDRP